MTTSSSRVCVPLEAFGPNLAENRRVDPCLRRNSARTFKIFGEIPRPPPNGPPQHFGVKQSRMAVRLDFRSHVEFDRLRSRQFADRSASKLWRLLKGADCRENGGGQAIDLAGPRLSDAPSLIGCNLGAGQIFAPRICLSRPDPGTRRCDSPERWRAVEGRRQQRAPLSRHQLQADPGRSPLARVAPRPGGAAHCPDPEAGPISAFLVGACVTVPGPQRTDAARPCGADAA